MTDDLDDEETLFEDEDLFVDLERRSLDEAGATATATLSSEAKHAAASFVVRAGLGPLFVRIAQSENNYDPTPEELGALMAISFNPEEDEFAAAVWDDLYREATGKVVLDPGEAREVADELADYDITAQLSDKEDGRPEEAVEWGRELRHRARDARDDG
jgi:hypothetical protein